MQSRTYNLGFIKTIKATNTRLDINVFFLSFEFNLNDKNWFTCLQFLGRDDKILHVFGVSWGSTPNVVNFE